MFWQKYEHLCNSISKKPRAVAKELNISPASVTSWKKGLVPNIEMLTKISNYFSVPVDFLINDDEISIKPQKKKTDMLFLTLMALPQRWVSLRKGDTVPLKTVLRIIEYINCNPSYIKDIAVTQYIPAEETGTERVYDTDTLFEILDIMDCCADSDDYKNLQIQLSRVVFYHISKKGYDYETITAMKEFDSKKIKFIQTGEENLDKTLNYGLNYSDLSMLRKITGLSYQYMFTGIEKSAIEILKSEKNDIAEKYKSAQLQILKLTERITLLESELHDMEK